MYCVYKHTSPSNKVYIGITSKNPLKRWRNGFGYYTNKYFYKAIVKYGWDNFKHEILLTNLNKEEAEQKEIELIKLYNSTDKDKGYNLREGNNNCTFSEETRKKISRSKIGNKNAMYGKTGDKHHNSRKVLCIETNIIYGSIAEAERLLGKRLHISCCCRGERDTAGGYHWKYVA